MNFGTAGSTKTAAYRYTHFSKHETPLLLHNKQMLPILPLAHKKKISKLNRDLL